MLEKIQNIKVNKNKNTESYKDKNRKNNAFIKMCGLGW